MATSKPKKLGKYDVLEIVGRGGMGVVYKAIDPAIGRLVAIKMMTVGYADDPELLRRFYREAQSAGKLQHPNIVTIYDLGDQDGNPYMVMEFLQGESLDSLISAKRAISLEEKLNIVVQICNALAYAHQRDVVHRDIKPGNVMVLKDLTIKLVDFGIARIGNEKVTRPGQIMGSIQYMSPEQINSSQVDSRTDIFSAGVLLYQLLADALPFDGKDTGAILLKIIHDAPPPLSKYLRDYPPELDNILARALTKEREERYATADDFAFDLGQVQEELKREKVSEYLKAVDELIEKAQWNQAKEQILQVLKIDRQNTRANELLRTIQQRIQRRQRSEQARELRSQAEQLIVRGELGDALKYLLRAVELDSENEELRKLRDAVAEKKEKSEQFASLLMRAESARDSGDLEEAQRNAAEALALDKDNREAKALYAIIAREIAEQNKLKQVQNYLDEARKRIASRSFTAALDVLSKAEILLPNAPGLKELANLATSGQEQEKRRKQLERFNAEIEDALNRDDYALACSKATEALRVFPEDRSLLKLRNLAEKQREASEKRAYVEAQIAESRRLLNSSNPDQSLIPLQEALRRYPQEPSLLSMLSVVNETLDRLRVERKKAEYVQRAKDSIRRKAYQEAIEILDHARREIPSSELDDLLQFAQEEAANFAVRKKIEELADQAHQLVAQHEYQQAIDLLESALLGLDDDELQIILADARRRLEEINQRVREAIATAERLLRNDRFGEAVKFLEGQLESCDESPEVALVLKDARYQLNRAQAFSVAKEDVRNAIAKDEFDAACTILLGFCDQYGESPDTKLLTKEIDTARSRIATTAMEKALSDVRMLVMVRSYDSAEGILESVAKWSAFAGPELQQQYESLKSFALRAKARLAASELAEKLNQARVSDQATISQIKSAGEGAEEVASQVDPTGAMGRTQLEAILGEVTEIADHYADNEQVQASIGDLKQRLTLRIAALDEEQAVAREPIQEHAQQAGIESESSDASPESASPQLPPADFEAPLPGPRPGPSDTESAATGIPEASQGAESPSQESQPEPIVSLTQQYTEPADQEVAEVVEPAGEGAVEREDISPQSVSTEMPSAEPDLAVAPPPSFLSEPEAEHAEPAAQEHEPAVDQHPLPELAQPATEKEMPAAEVESKVELPVPEVKTEAEPKLQRDAQEEAEVQEPLRLDESSAISLEPAPREVIAAPPSAISQEPLPPPASSPPESKEEPLRLDESAVIPAEPTRPKVVPRPVPEIVRQPPSPVVVRLAELPRVRPLPPPKAKPISSRPAAPARRPLADLLTPLSALRQRRVLLGGAALIVLLAAIGLWKLLPARSPSQPGTSAPQSAPGNKANSAEGSASHKSVQSLTNPSETPSTESNHSPTGPEMHPTDRYDEAKSIVIKSGKVSEGALRRQMKIGNTEAKQYLDRMVSDGLLAQTRNGFTLKTGPQASGNNLNPPATGAQGKATAAPPATGQTSTQFPAQTGQSPPVTTQPVTAKETPEMLEARDWDKVRAANDPAQLQSFLSKYPGGPHLAEGQAKLQEMLWQSTNRDDLAALQGYLSRYPAGSHSAEASGRIEELRWNQLDKNDRNTLIAFKANYPNSPHRKDVDSILSSLQEKASVLGALDRFNLAWKSQDPRELKKIWPSAPKKYTDYMRPTQGYAFAMELQCTGNNSIDSDTATAPCQLVSTTTTPGGQKKATKAVKVRLQKSGNDWLILDPTAN